MHGCAVDDVTLCPQPRAHFDLTTNAKRVDALIAGQTRRARAEHLRLIRPQARDVADRCVSGVVHTDHFERPILIQVAHAPRIQWPCGRQRGVPGCATQPHASA